MNPIYKTSDVASWIHECPDPEAYSFQDELCMFVGQHPANDPNLRRYELAKGLWLR
jgi:hypothetical protein